MSAATIRSLLVGVVCAIALAASSPEAQAADSSRKKTAKKKSAKKHPAKKHLVGNR